MKFTSPFSGKVCAHEVVKNLSFSHQNFLCFIGMHLTSCYKKKREVLKCGGPDLKGLDPWFCFPPDSMARSNRDRVQPAAQILTSDAHCLQILPPLFFREEELRFLSDHNLGWVRDPRYHGSEFFCVSSMMLSTLPHTWYMSMTQKIIFTELTNEWTI